MSDNHPLISATTGNKVLVAVIIAVITAVLSWMTSATLTMKQNEQAIREDILWIQDSITEGMRNLNYTNERVDVLMELLVKEVLVDEYRNTRDAVERVHQDLQKRETGN